MDSGGVSGILPRRLGCRGQVDSLSGTLVDVTQRRKLERQLLQQEEFRRRLLESFPDLIVVSISRRSTPS